MAADRDAVLLALGAHRFVDQEPAGDFLWLFFDVEGAVSEYPTTQLEYQRFKALYGVPQTRWRATGQTRDGEEADRG